MCGRYTLTAGPGEIARRFGLEHVPERVTRRYNVAPGQRVLAIVSDGEGRRPELLRWGLTLPWTGDPSGGRDMINARSETVRRKKSFRTLVESSRGRVLIIADGFYEWPKAQHARAPRVPVRFTLATSRPFAFAGLWTTWRTADGEAIATCAILTTSANEAVARVHDRMPAIVADHAIESAWLDPSTDGEAATELLRPLPSFLMRATTASRLVNSTRNEGPELLETERAAAA